MEVENSLHQVLQVLRTSGLHFSAQETPHSSYISIRKKFREDNKWVSNSVPHNHQKNYLDLTKQCQNLEKVCDAIRKELEQEISDHDKTVKELKKVEKHHLEKDILIKNVKNENKGLKAEVDNLDSEIKLLKKDLKNKVKEVYDSNKENEAIEQSLAANKIELNLLSVKVKRYEKEETKRSKVKQSKDIQKIV